jgi:hypothetical protein
MAKSSLAQSWAYDAIVAAGLVVDGGIYPHEFVAQEVITGLLQAQLETWVPVISAVGTPHHFHAQNEHQAFFREHFLIKDAEAIHACADTMEKCTGTSEQTQTSRLPACTWQCVNSLPHPAQAERRACALLFAFSPGYKASFFLKKLRDFIFSYNATSACPIPTTFAFRHTPS